MVNGITLGNMPLSAKWNPNVFIRMSGETLNALEYEYSFQSTTYFHGDCQGCFSETNMLIDELKVDEKR